MEHHGITPSLSIWWKFFDHVRLQFLNPSNCSASGLNDPYLEWW